MKQELTITIDVPEGKKIYWDGSKLIIKSVELPKTWEEFCETHPVQKGEAYINSCSCVLEISKVRARGVKNNLPDKQVAEQHLALMQLHQLRDCYRQGWIPDWKSEEQKYTIFQGTTNCYKVASSYFVPAFLSFQSREIAELFINNFKDLIKQAGDLI